MIDLTKFKVYIVGGYVRDRILGRECKDHDFVVVGATPQDMLAAGFNKVGADFPVFLHPVSGDEFALARTERKTSAGYSGFETDFSTSITLKDDLCRRDLTVNAMAREVVGWNDQGHAKLSDEIIDHFKGQRDLKKGILRHVSKAFAEDPVRVLRVARFSARFGFEIAPDTLELMEKLVNEGELDHLVPERVWTELEKAMGEDEPINFFWALKKCGADRVLFPEMGRSIISSGYSLHRASLHRLPVTERLVIVFSGVPLESVGSLLVRLKAPTNIQRLTKKMRTVLDILELDNKFDKLTARHILSLLNEIDAFRNDSDITTLIVALSTFHSRIRDRYDRVLAALREARKVSFATLSDKQKEKLAGADIGKAIDKLRLKKIQAIFS